MSSLYLQLNDDGDSALILAVSARAGGDVTGYYGPFPDQAAVDAAKDAMLAAGIDLGHCETQPLRRVVSQP
jgi:sugar/nucleoside kinase (ribokinase family)